MLNSPKNSAEQQTSLNSTPISTHPFKIVWFSTTPSSWFFRVVARRNGKTVAQSEGYKRKGKMMETVRQFGFPIEQGLPQK